MTTSTYFTVVHGDKYDGLLLYGPFYTQVEATEWAAKSYLWYVVVEAKEPVRPEVVCESNFEPLSIEEVKKYFPESKESVYSENKTRPLEEKSSFSGESITDSSVSGESVTKSSFSQESINSSILSDQKGIKLVSDLSDIVNELQNKLYNAREAQRELQEAKYDLDNAEDEMSTFIEDLEGLIDSLEDVPVINISVSVDVEFDSERV